MPADIADGDDDITYTADTGLTLSTNEFSVNFNGDGFTNTVSRNDHTHFGQSWVGISQRGLWVQNLSVAQFAAGLVGVSTSSTGAGVSAYNFEPSGFTRGVFGDADSTEGVGVSGLVSATTGANFGVFGSAESTEGTGVAGYAAATSGINRGVSGTSLSSAGVGVRGEVSATMDFNYGVLGISRSISGTGVAGIVDASSGMPIGGYRANLNALLGWAGVFDGDVNVNDILFKDAGAFRIDHPLDPANKYLNHPFVESPDMMNIYNGNATSDEHGEAWIQLPDWFEALNKGFRYQLTPIGAPGPNLHVAEPVANNQFKIAGGTASMTVSWQVTGVRHDPHAEAHRLRQSVSLARWVTLPERPRQPAACVSTSFS